MKVPKITTVMTVYNAENFIERRLKSIFMQRGNFLMELCLLEDCCTDNTREVIRNCISSSNIPSNITIKYLYNSENIGRQENYNRYYALLRESKSDYACILDSDDWWTTPDFITNHMNYHRFHPRCPATMCMSYLYYQNEDKYIIHPQQNELYKNNVKKLTSHMYACDNPSPNTGGGFYKINAIKKMPQELVNFTWADWLFHFFLSWQGDFGFLHDVMAVYRIHSEGEYAGGQAEETQARKRSRYENFLSACEFVEERYPNIYTEELKIFSRNFFPEFQPKN